MRAGCAALVLLLLGGCPQSDGKGTSEDGGSAAGSGAASGNGSTPCAAHLAWEKKCEVANPGSVAQPYWGETECPKGPWSLTQTAVVRAMIDCFGTLGCGNSDHVCTVEGLSAIGINTDSDVTGNAPYQSCVDQTRTCNVVNDDCLDFLAFTEQGRGLAAKCLSQPCDTLAACLADPRMF
ncbi:MAG: hypothetical protein ACHQ53_14185 [Polyangiales bacterium]